MPNEDDIKFEALLADKRHKELTGTLKGLVTILSKEKPNDGIKEAIEKQSKAIEGFANAIKNIPKPEKQEKPQVNVAVSNDNMISSIEKMCKEICDGQNKILKALEEKPIVDEFKLEKDQWGTTRTVKLVYKTAATINYGKIKAQA